MSASRLRATWIEIVESYIGGLLSMLFAFEVIVGGILVVVDPPSGNLHVPKRYAIPILAAAVFFDGWLVLTAWGGLRDRRFPLALGVALRQPSWPVVLRPIVAMIWLAHAIALAFSAYGMHVALNVMGRVGGGSLADSIAIEIALLLVVFGLTFLCNIYILLVLESMAPRSRAQYVFWRMRFVLDVVLTLAAFLAARRVGG